MTTLTIHFHGYVAIEVEDDADAEAAFDEFMDDMYNIVSDIDIDLKEVY
jgi:hypothetical protein